MSQNVQKSITLFHEKREHLLLMKDELKEKEKVMKFHAVRLQECVETYNNFLKILNYMEHIKRQYNEEYLSRKSSQEKFYLYYELLKNERLSDSEFHKVLDFYFNFYEIMHIKRKNAENQTIEQYLNNNITQEKNSIEFHRNKIKILEEQILDLLNKIKHLEGFQPK